MHVLQALSEPMVSALQYFLDTVFGGLMIFIFAQVPPRKNNVVSMVILILCSYGLVLATIVIGNKANIGILYTVYVHLPLILCFIFFFKVPVSIVLILHFLTYNLLSSRLFFGNLLSIPPETCHQFRANPATHSG